MYSLEEIIKQNNPKGDQEEWKKGKKKSKVEIIHLSELSWGEKLKKLEDLYEGR